nr:MAG TPA: hypothetical protein [Caudoviricetes sp.]
MTRPVFGKKRLLPSAALPQPPPSGREARRRSGKEETI